ncbi:hypothetical protein K504DRAFT_403128 [Pleomassaria siparia CBS 279.74]|uniref:Pal1-domain-containing protein n=1 Tax=Pleomassaria siparia CBS 279.74 TaxID=1314801 RepID=A0A6G1KG19_9PLEO|nr:hypothetical protein K504DRAFT_403128 [Pleomassaria siparia CBS 279.74]
MARIDSGFGASSFEKSTDTDPSSLHGSNTAPTRPRRSRNIPSNPTSIPQSTDMPSKHPASEKRSSAGRQSTTEPRRPSLTSSSENSATKCRSRGHGSKLSSHRTSCTLIDPSRPTRHYRIKSSQSISTANRGDIDDVLALHFRSCSLFENPSYYSPQPSPVISGYPGAGPRTSMGSRHAPASGLLHQERSDYIGYDFHANCNNNSPIEQKQEEEAFTPPEQANTTMHWMSPSTRRQQYEKIDKANSGLRGFVSRIVPRCVSGPPAPKFYEKDQSDAGSVRRYRISNEEEHEEEGDEDLEKSVSIDRPLQVRKTRPTTATAKSSSSLKKWACF